MLDLLLEATPEGYEVASGRGGVESHIWPTTHSEFGFFWAAGFRAERIAAGEALRSMREGGGSKAILGLVSSGPNPYRLLMLRTGSFSGKGKFLESLGPAGGWAQVVGGLVEIVADTILAVANLGGAGAPVGVAEGVAAAYSIPSGVARIQRGLLVVYGSLSDRGGVD